MSGYWFYKSGKRIFTRVRARDGVRGHGVDNYSCFGCGRGYNRKRWLHNHQGNLWPACPIYLNQYENFLR